MAKSRLDKLYRVTVTSGNRQTISFFKKKTTVNKYITSAKKLAKKYNQKIRIYISKPKR